MVGARIPLLCLVLSSSGAVCALAGLPAFIFGDDFETGEVGGWASVSGLTVCGNGILEGSETCDDGDKDGGDGCSSVCRVEPGYQCNTSVEPSVCTPLTGALGSACITQADCTVGDGLCLYGFCTSFCGPGQAVADCNAQATHPSDSAVGSALACWSLGLTSLCWPNGSGEYCLVDQDCARVGETCVDNRCQYTTGGGAPRTDFRCYRDSDCENGEGCAIFGNLDPATSNIRSDGACLYNGDPPDQRRPPGASCSQDKECGSFFCSDGCRGLCLSDADCPSQDKCMAIGLLTDSFAEFESIFQGVCVPWGGSRTSCTANASCLAGETCEPVQDLVAGDLDIDVNGACRALPNPGAAASVGGSCTADSQCRSGNCLVNPLTGLGYCFDACFGGDADCGGGTLCRSLLYNGRDPATTNDDVRAPFCVQTQTGSSCFVNSRCTSCDTDGDCNAPQGVTCVRANPSDATGICRDAFGRCAEPCRHDCTPGGDDCQDGSVCATGQNASGQPVNYCADQAGRCVPADMVPLLTYENGMCGDGEYPLDGSPPLPQQDLCYYYGRQNVGIPPQPTDIFACGVDCSGMAMCPDIPLLYGSLPTTCRQVYEFGLNLGVFGTIGGAALSPDQCAPPSAFAPQP